MTLSPTAHGTRDTNASRSEHELSLWGSCTMVWTSGTSKSIEETTSTNRPSRLDRETTRCCPHAVDAAFPITTLMRSGLSTRSDKPLTCLECLSEIFG